MLKRGKRGAFYTHKMNGFINVSSPRPQLQQLTNEQAQLIREKIERYSQTEYRSIFKTAVFTLIITTGLIMLLGELWKWIN